jgi:hypothetical protein
MLDLRCILYVLRATGEKDIAAYLESLATEDLYNSICRDLGKYLKGELNDE